MRKINGNSIAGAGNTISDGNNFTVRNKHVGGPKNAVLQELCMFEPISHRWILLVFRVAGI